MRILHPWMPPTQTAQDHVDLRSEIEEAVDRAVEGGALSEEWAMSILAALGEPPEGDDKGWGILEEDCPA